MITRVSLCNPFYSYKEEGMKSKELIQKLTVGLVVLVLLAGCGGQVTPETALQTEEGGIFFTADQDHIEAGQCTFLRWEVREGFSAVLNGEEVALAGEKEVCPVESQSYELSVDMGTRVETRTVEIIVGGEVALPAETEQETATPGQGQEAVTPGVPAYQAQAWVRLGGPPGGLGYDIRMDPRNPDVMFVTASPGGIFKSVDGGQSWITQNEGLETYPGSGANIFCATIDPHNPDHIWIGTQFTGHVYLSTDGGDTWQERDEGITQKVGENSIRGITIDPNDQDVVYVGMERGTGMGGVTGEVYKSTDGGENFTMIWQGDNLARYVWVDPQDSQRLFVSTGIFDRVPIKADQDNLVCGGVGIVRSEDGGSTWTVLDEDNGLGGTYIPSLYMHPTDPDILIAAVTAMDWCPDAQPGVYVTRDGGDTWTLSLPASTMEAVEISETNPNIWYAASRGVFWRSDDSGGTWHEYLLKTANRGAGIPIDLQADPRDPMRIFDNNYKGGNFLSEDGGETWVDASSGYSGATVFGLAVSAGDGGTVLAGAETSTFLSTDGGVHWVGSGIEGEATRILRYTAADGSDSLIASGPAGDSSVYLSSDGGQSWEDVQVTTTAALQVPGFMRARALVVAPSDPQVMYLGYGGGSCIIADWPFCVDSSPGFFRSQDGGYTWEKVSGAAFGTASILTAAVPVDDAQTVYVGTMKGLFVTHDGGDSWAEITSLEEQAPWREMGGVQVPPALVIVADPFDAQTLYVGTQSMGLWLSQDGGASWEQASVGMDPNEFILGILPDPNTPGLIYAASAQSGVYVSTDGAATWSKIGQGLDFRGMRSLALSEDGSVLYAGSTGAGVFRLGNPPGDSP
jgi:photosystem II stability/assembly factor-like uncharacterized protein